MKRLLLSTLLFLFACNQSDPTQPDPADLAQFGADNPGSVTFGEPCSLAYGESLLLGDDELEVGFDRFLGDDGLWRTGRERQEPDHQEHCKRMTYIHFDFLLYCRAGQFRGERVPPRPSRHGLLDT